jgi:hypothetical protein
MGNGWKREGKGREIIDCIHTRCRDVYPSEVNVYFVFTSSQILKFVLPVPSFFITALVGTAGRD